MTVFALGCHPDDIEFMMAGTLFLLKKAGCELHLMCLANGNCGSMELGPERIVAIRARESRNAAQMLGAEMHESLANDLEIYFTDDLVRRMTAVVRRVKPDIVLLPSPEDYMEDHMNTTRIGVTAFFYRNIPNYHTIPPVPATFQDVVLYHAMPYGLTDNLRRTIHPDLFVDVTLVIEDKERMLACHESQKAWLDKSQGLDSYLISMRDMTRRMGDMSGRYDYAEGWRRHSHLGYSKTETDVLPDLLNDYRLVYCPRNTLT